VKAGFGVAELPPEDLANGTMTSAARNIQVITRNTSSNAVSFETIV
jgi:hypothetical protein